MMKGHKGNEFFDEIAPRWDEVAKHDPMKIFLLVEKMVMEPGMSVLDVGTGTGILVPWILPRITQSGKLTAIDLSSGMLEVAKNKFQESNISFLNADIHNYTFTERFDRIIVYSAFPHFLNKHQAIKNMANHLKPDGTLQVCHSSSRAHINGVHEKTEQVKNDYLPDSEEVGQMFESAGLKVVESVDNNEIYLVRGQKA
jgi:demethylmenaquinone methyltransferase/2-methoxy-6-polyprenyl-1,4-benzoquinol methylase